MLVIHGLVIYTCIIIVGGRHVHSIAFILVCNVVHNISIIYMHVGGRG
jgi:hypothetical protein